MVPEIPDVRPLTGEERALARRMLEGAGADAAPFLAQLASARVVSRCGCGCASVNFAVEGHPPAVGGLHVLGDYEYDGPEGLTGAFIFEQGGVLSGIEVYGLDGGAPAALPAPDALRPLGAP